ncbi:MAG: hypothetical protein ABW219_13130 [Ilumatobacteraceae bacterium]
MADVELLLFEHGPPVERARSDVGEQIVNRPVLAAAAVVALLATSCTGDDDTADPTTAPVTTQQADTTAVTTTEAVATTPAPTDPPTTTAAPTTEAPTTTIDEEALKAQIAADYQRSWANRNALAENPTLDGLDEKLAGIAVPGSGAYDAVRVFFRGLVDRGESVVPGTPDLFRIDVEDVELSDVTPLTEATVTICFISNRRRLDAQGNVIVGSDALIAARRLNKVQLTPNGWLPTDGFTDLWQGLDVAECPPA